MFQTNGIDQQVESDLLDLLGVILQVVFWCGSTHGVFMLRLVVVFAIMERTKKRVKGDTPRATSSFSEDGEIRLDSKDFWSSVNKDATTQATAVHWRRPLWLTQQSLNVTRGQVRSANPTGATHHCGHP